MTGGSLRYIRGQRPPPIRPAMGDLNTDWTMGSRPAASGWPPVCTLATTTWPPARGLYAEAQDKGAGGELSTLMRGMMNAQANDSGRPTFSGKYVEYPRFRK
jgi:hypothetical protein